MSIDTHEFVAMFIEESTEMLKEMENAILNANEVSQGSEEVNCLFRVVHSIKGGSAVFNFTPITNFAHDLESFLGEVRENQRSIKKLHLELLLEAVDCFRNMLSCVQEKKPIDDNKARKIIEALLEGKRLDDQSVEGDISRRDIKIHSEKNNVMTWEILFKPYPDIFKETMDILGLFKLLSEMGKLKSELNTEKFPDFRDLDPMSCYLSWKLILQTPEIEEKDLKDIFDWVSDSAEVQFKQVFSDNVSLYQKHEVEKTMVVSENVIINEANQEKNAGEEPSSGEDFKVSMLTQGMPKLNSIRIDTKKVDDLMNIVAELVITQSMFKQIIKKVDSEESQILYQALLYLENNIRELQESVMNIRMVPIAMVFERFPRMLHDLARKMGKKIDLKIVGDQTELDKTMIERITDPLIHLVRNAIDHGIEPVNVRKKLGKPETGIIRMNVSQEGGHIIISISDDGSGLDLEKIRKKAISKQLITEQEEVSENQLKQFIFYPGFSTVEKATEVSGRGVGLDVVLKNIRDIDGRITVNSVPKVGTLFRIRLPLTLAIMDCQLMQFSDKVFIIPLMDIVEIIKLEPSLLSHHGEGSTLYHLREKHVPVIYLSDILGLPRGEEKSLIFVEFEGQMYGLVCEELLSQQQVVIKSLEENYRRVPGISGATILGDGSVVLILDTKMIVSLFLRNQQLKKSLKEGHDTPEYLTIHDFQDNMENKEHTEEEETRIKNGSPVQFLGFFWDDQEYGIDALDIKEIINREKTTDLPNVPDYIKGIINLHGSIIPVLDFGRSLLKIASDETDEAKLTNTIISLSVGNKKKRTFGIIVDKVSQIYQVNFEEIKAFPETGEHFLKEYVEGLVDVGEKTITLLNAKKLLSAVE